MTADEKQRLVAIHRCLAVGRETGPTEKLIEAANLMSEYPGFPEFLAANPQKVPPQPWRRRELQAVHFIFLMSLLYKRDYEGAATLLWGPETFTCEPHFVKLIWNALTKHRLINILGCASAGKCLGPEVKVMMFDGSQRAARDIKEGDVLMGDDSTPRRVLTKSEGFGPMYRIVPERGESWTCNDAHILSLRCNQQQLCGSGKPNKKWVKNKVYDIPLSEWIGFGQNKKSKLKMFTVGFDLPNRPLEFDPYIYGCWIGDGGIDVPAIHKPDGPMAQEWVRYFESIGYRVSVGYRDKCPMWCARMSGVEGGGGKQNPFTEFIRKSVNGKIKFIRDEYLKNSRANRLKLLAGLIDSDGTLAHTTGYNIVNKEESIIRDIAWLARSLGFAARTRKRTHSIKSIGFSGEYWHVDISGHGITEIPTLQKKAQETTSKKDLTNVGFKAEPLGDGEFHGFVIDGNHRFLLGDCTVTHNTYSPAARFLLEWILDPEFTLVRVMSTKEDHCRKNLFADMQRLYSGSVIQLPGKAEADAIATETGKRGGQGIFMIVIPRGADAGGTIKGSKVKPRPEHPLFGTSSRTFLLIDEAQEVPENAFTEIPNLFSSMEENDVEHTKIVMSANPKETLSEYGKRCEPTTIIGGWQAVQTRESLVEEWESEKGWHCVRLNALKCENVVQNKTVFARFITANGVRMKIKDAGGDPEHPIIWSEVYGMFPPAGSMTAVIQKHWVDRARREWIFESATQTVAAEDVALSGDLPTLSCGRIGRAVAWRDYEGNRHELKEPRWVLQADVVGLLPRTNDSQLLADETMERLKQLGVKPELFGIDRTGVGQGTGDIMRHQWKQKVDASQPSPVQIMMIHWGEKPTDVLICSEDTKTPREIYDNVIAEMWYAAAKFFEYEYIAIGRNVDDFTVSELVGRLGGSPAGKGKLKTVESKDLFKLRNNGKSCDRADAFIQMVHVARIATKELRPKAPDTEVAPPVREKTQAQGGLVFGSAIGFESMAPSFELTGAND